MQRTLMKTNLLKLARLCILMLTYGCMCSNEKSIQTKSETSNEEFPTEQNTSKESADNDWRIRAHLYTYSDDAKVSAPTFGLYTYVLYRPVLSQLDTSENKLFFDRLNKLINAIEDTTDPFDTTVFTIDYKYHNLFIIPENYRKGSKSPVLYPHVFSVKLASAFSDRQLQRVFSSNIGPFLISSKQPLNEYSHGAKPDLLFVNLSNTNPDAMKQIVSFYKERIITDDISGIEQFSSLKASILSFILDADDNIKVVKASIASILSFFD